MQLHILRDGQELGVLPAAEALELLQAGFLRGTDEFWTESPGVRQPLTRLLEAKDSSRPDWLARAQSSVSSAGRAIQARALDLTGKVSALARGRKAALAASTARALEGYLPRLRELTTESLGKMARSADSALHDEVFLRKLFGAVYDCLPKAVGRFVSEIAFVEFCLKHRQWLLIPNRSSVETPESTTGDACIRPDSNA